MYIHIIKFTFITNLSIIKISKKDKVIVECTIYENFAISNHGFKRKEKK